jgi:hypothetical protein
VRAITIGTNSKICPNCKGEGTVSPPEPVKPVEGLLEQLTEWVTDYKDVASRNALAETPKESAEYLLSLIPRMYIMTTGLQVSSHC